MKDRTRSMSGSFSIDTEAELPPAQIVQQRFYSAVALLVGQQLPFFEEDGRSKLIAKSRIRFQRHEYDMVSLRKRRARSIEEARSMFIDEREDSIEHELSTDAIPFNSRCITPFVECKDGLEQCLVTNQA